MAYDPNEWRPTQKHKTGYLPGEGIQPYLREDERRTRIGPGSIIVFDGRHAHEVVEVAERPVDLWPEHFRGEWRRYVEWRMEHVLEGRITGPEPDKAMWEHRPLVLVLRPADQPAADAVHYAVRASRTFFVLPDHYSVCRLCQEIPPCTHATTEKTIDREMAKVGELMAIPRGACLGCGKTITGRMKKILFPGPNLWRPDWGNHTAVFHGRQQEECSNGAWRYEQQWKERGLDQLTGAPSAVGEAA